MKKFYTLLLLALMLIPAITVNADNINVNGTQRTYYKYVPSGMGENRPLLISMHGMNQDANYQRGMLNIESVCDTAKFAVVFPEGLNRSWDISGTRDIDFVLAVIDDMATKHKIDKNRVYLSGFSMGGMFTYHAINHIADKIAAFAPISGYPMGGQPFTSSRPVPIIHTHGTGDDVVTFDGVQRSLDGWILRNGCAPVDFVTEKYRASIVTRHQWGPGEDGVEVTMMELAGKGHWISNDNGYHTGDEIWKFCSRYSLNQKLPKVNITFPGGGADVTSIGAATDMRLLINADAYATDPDAQIASLSIYGDNELLATFTEPPYTYDWAAPKLGQHMIKVTATDTKGVTSARGIPVKVKGTKKSLNVSSNFTEDGIMPTGWISTDGRNNLVGPVSGLTARSRVIKFTGAQHDFTYGLYILNITGNAEAGYAAFGNAASTAQLNLPKGTYSFTFKTCNYNAPNNPDIIARVVNAVTKEVIAETTVTPTVNIGNNPANSFSGATNVELSFQIEQPTFCELVFYAGPKRKDDAVIADIKVTRVSTTDITDITAPEATAVSTKYFDVYGRQLSQPANGMVIKSVTYSDGTVKNEKLIVR